MILVIDNYDSFTYNLVHYLLELGAAVEVVRNDAVSAAQALALRPQAIVLSPGPCAPAQAGVCLDLIAAAADAGTPLLGVCLGHQAIGEAFGGRVIRAAQLMHGKTSEVVHDGRGVFAGLPSPFVATRYHSLIVEAATLPEVLIANAHVVADGVAAATIMGLRHRTLPIHGVQFHPESIASEHGHALLANFLALAGVPTITRAAA
ncbi:aminodeoxychorismate/anthranilate synthase component II [Polymorphobacter sp. PAMC 29334]|uniref:anthranilate synthase component II n=1 Tax=Polymorphobacter sp. PAMC 29334 TaxID=2862331 RepID=UPI001C66FF2B|nr:aminodeoxychorismate/anthranilate synthase component II [Polymorphobacter sp. PAMC 29334]QYE34039.1 aminodeoxychorismate/anthranilate synthase component II [Polymorphobacter sp. PAMC 29334]